ncbi:MAG TPA: PAS domain S-box protein, partial [Flavisolibacter sp.]
MKKENLLVVAIGASAGALKALRGIFGPIVSLPQDTCFIVAHHLSPRYKSRLAELLSTKHLQVRTAAGGDVLQAGQVYVTPPGRNIIVSEGAISLKQADTLYKPSIDLLFQSVATGYRGKAVGIVLSGTGKDGAAGVKAIRENGGLTMVEMPQEAECDGMPLAAIATGCVDIEARTTEMMAIVEHYAMHGKGSHPASIQAAPESEMAEVLKRVKARCGTDFSHYKSTTVWRRVQRRVSLLGLGSLKDYLKHTTENHAELEALHRDLMISVTAFFRDKHAFRFLQTTNEKPETSNEELQSASQEMVATFNELQEVYRLLEKKEEEIRATANRLQAILENSSQGYLLVNEQYRIIFFNHEADAIIRKLTGSPVAHGSSVFNCAPLQTQDSFKKNLDRAFAGEAVEYETEEKCGSETVWLRFRYVPVHGTAGKIETALISYIDLSGEINARKLIEVKEANLNSVVENFDGYVWSMDWERRYITFNSLLKNEIKRIYGVEVRPGDKVQGLLETLDPRRSGEWEKLYDAAFEGKPQRLVHEFNTNGRQSYFELSLNPISDGKEVLGLSCFARDITEQVTRKNQLDAMESRYRSLIENSLDGISLLDVDGKFSYLTPSVKRILGYEPAELEGKSPRPYIHPEDTEKFASLVQGISRKQGQSTNANFRVMHKNGGWKWLNCNITNMLHQPAVKAIVFNYKDISERVAAEEKLLSSHEKLVASQMLAKVGSWEFGLDSLDDLENTPVEWSDEAYHIFGYKPGQVKVTSGFFFGMVYPDDRVKIREAVMGCINGGKPNDVEYRVRLKDGSTRFIHDRMRIIYSSSGKPLRIAGACQDITDRKLNEIKIIQSEANLRGILDNSNTAFQLFDTSFNIVAFNQLAYEWTLAENGKKLEPGRSFSYYIKKEHHDYFREFYQKALDGQDVCFEYTGRNTGRNFYINIKRIMDGDGRAHGICISTIDLTEQKRAERAIMDSEMLYRSLFNNSPLPKWVCDKKTLRFLEVNDTAIHQYGYSREEFLAMTAYDLRVEEEHSVIDDVLARGSQVLRNRLATHRRKNGELVFATVYIHELHYKGVDAYLVLANDVTETLNLQKALSEEKLNKQIEINRTVLYVQEQERMELGRELHDNVNQMLASVKLYMDTALADNTNSRDLIGKGRMQVVKCIEELRRISKSLVPPSLGDLSLGEALEE